MRGQHCSAVAGKGDLLRKANPKKGRGDRLKKEKRVGYLREEKEENEGTGF